MKQYILAGTALLALMLPSCSEDNLDIPHKGVVSYEEFYSDPNNAENAATFVYQTGMYAHWLGEGNAAGSGNPWIWQGALNVLFNASSDDLYWASGHKSDHISGLQPNEFNQNFDANNETTIVSYGALYNMNRGANLLLDNYSYDMVPDDPNLNAIVNRSVSEAKVARAYAHFLLATYWGNPPLVDHQITSGKPGNTPHDEIIDFCIKELGEAAPYLPSKSKVNDPDMTVRYTKEFALALKGKVELFAKRWADAKNSLEAVINSGLYELVDGRDLQHLFHTKGDCCKEWLFQYNCMDNAGLNAGSGQYSFHFPKSTSWVNLRSYPDQTVDNSWGSMNPRKEFSEALIANDGMDSWRRQAWIVTYDELCNGKVITGPDKSANDTVLSYPAKKKNRGVNVKGVFGNAGYWQYKRIPLVEDLNTLVQGADYKGTNTSSGVNFPIMRYAEVLLMYAEACAQLGETSGKGLDALNAIQKRAGVKAESISTALSLQAVKNEKRLECFLEGTRFPDLVRWGDAVEFLGEQGGYVPTAYDKSSTDRDDIKAVKDGDTIDGNKYEVVDYGGGHVLVMEYIKYNSVYGFKEGKHEVWPYPRNELNVNPNIQQNPGY